MGSVTGLSKTQQISATDIGDMLRKLVGQSENVFLGPNKTLPLGTAVSAQIADFNRDGEQDIKIIYDSGYEVILVDRDAFGNAQQMMRSAAEKTQSKDDDTNVDFLLGKFQAFQQEVDQYDGKKNDDRSTLNFDSGTGNKATEQVFADVQNSDVYALIQKKSAAEKVFGETITFTNGMATPTQYGQMRAVFEKTQPVIETPPARRDFGNPFGQNSNGAAAAEGLMNGALNPSMHEYTPPKTTPAAEAWGGPYGYTDQTTFESYAFLGAATKQWGDLNQDGENESKVRVTLPDGRTGTVYAMNFQNARGKLVEQETDLLLKINRLQTEAAQYDTGVTARINAEAQIAKLGGDLATVRGKLAELDAIGKDKTAATPDLDDDGIPERPVAEFYQTVGSGAKVKKSIQMIAVFEPDQR